MSRAASGPLTLGRGRRPLERLIEFPERLVEPSLVWTRRVIGFGRNGVPELLPPVLGGAELDAPAHRLGAVDHALVDTVEEQTAEKSAAGAYSCSLRN
jgi:hypothetical protein